jgi:hypothetical protein
VSDNDQKLNPLDKVNSDKIKNVIKLDSQDRYEYSIREFVKLEKVWAVLVADSWVT